MDTASRTSIVLGIHLYDDYLCAAYYESEMPEARIIVNPHDESGLWLFDTGNESETWDIVLKKNLQGIINCIFDMLDGNILCVTFSVPELSESTVCELSPILADLDLGTADYYLQEDNESFYDFVTFQNSELWTNEVVLFEERDKKLYAKSLVSAAFPHEKALTVKATSFDDFSFGNEDQETDREFSELVQEFFDRRLVSCVFLEGDTFGNNWMKETLKVLCKKRRVFGVDNTIVKGACYRSYRKSLNDMKAKYYMGEHQLPFSIAMNVTEDGRNEICRLVRAGTNWYDADFMWHFMVNETEMLRFRTEPSIKGVERYIDVDISKFPHRPENATKVEVSIHFAGKNSWYIKVRDLGLGELYPSSNMEETVYVGEW